MWIIFHINVATLTEAASLFSIHVLTEKIQLLRATVGYDSFPTLFELGVSL